MHCLVNIQLYYNVTVYYNLQSKGSDEYEFYVLDFVRSLITVPTCQVQSMKFQKLLVKYLVVMEMWETSYMGKTGVFFF